MTKRTKGQLVTQAARLAAVLDRLEAIRLHEHHNAPDGDVAASLDQITANVELALSDLEILIQ